MIDYNARFKYRVWHRQFAKFLTAEEWCIDMNGRLLFFDITQNKLLPCDVDKNFIIQPCTGAEDKNKKLIYEGDILKVKRSYIRPFVNDDRQIDYKHTEGEEEVGYVCWSPFQYKYVVAFRRYDDYDDFNGIDHRLEVIGNICENEELVRNNNNYM